MLGDNESLCMLSLSDDGLFKFSDKDIRRVTQINVIKEENMIAMLAGQSGNLFVLGVYTL